MDIFIANFEVVLHSRGPGCLRILFGLVGVSELEILVILLHPDQVVEVKWAVHLIFPLWLSRRLNRRCVGAWLDLESDNLDLV